MVDKLVKIFSDQCIEACRKLTTKKVKETSNVEGGVQTNGKTYTKIQGYNNCISIILGQLLDDKRKLQNQISINGLQKEIDQIILDAKIKKITKKSYFKRQLNKLINKIKSSYTSHKVILPLRGIKVRKTYVLGDVKIRPLTRRFITTLRKDIRGESSKSYYDSFSNREIDTIAVTNVKASGSDKAIELGEEKIEKALSIPRYV